MFKKILVFVLSLTLFLGAVSLTYAKVSPKATPTPTPVPVVDSFSLFWPVAAGKTAQSKVYFLKIWKEDLRGFLIFGSAQKADYDIFLGIKRVLEAEVLMKGNVTDLANSTLDSAVNDLNKANSALTNAKNSGDIDQGTKDEINTRVSNLKKFVAFLQNKYPDFKNKLQNVMDKLNSIVI